MNVAGQEMDIAAAVEYLQPQPVRHPIPGYCAVIPGDMLDLIWGYMQWPRGTYTAAEIDGAAADYAAFVDKYAIDPVIAARTWNVYGVPCIMADNILQDYPAVAEYIERKFIFIKMIGGRLVIGGASDERSDEPQYHTDRGCQTWPLLVQIGSDVFDMVDYVQILPCGLVYTSCYYERDYNFMPALYNPATGDFVEVRNVYAETGALDDFGNIIGDISAEALTFSKYCCNYLAVRLIA